MTGEAPHLLDPEVLDSGATQDGKQRGLYYCPSSQGRSPESAAEFVDSIFEVLPSCPGLPMIRPPRLTDSSRRFPATKSCKVASAMQQDSQQEAWLPGWEWSAAGVSTGAR